MSTKNSSDTDANRTRDLPTCSALTEIGLANMFGMKANYSKSLLVLVGRFSAVGIATNYGLDGQESNPGGGEIFLILPDRPRGPPKLPYKGYWVIPGGKAAGAWRRTPTPIWR
jgi:hypothetical protein